MSQGVKQGGIFNLPRANYSEETKRVIGEMMKEARLSMLSQRRIRSVVEAGRSLPVKPPQTYPQTSLQPPRRLRPMTAMGKRSLELMKKMGAYDIEPFRPKRTRDLEKEKLRLQNLMAYGEENPQLSEEDRVRLFPPPQRPTHKFEEVWDEIQERRDFLEEMEKLGQGHKYRALIQGQIAQKVQELGHEYKKMEDRRRENAQDYFS